MLRLFFIIFACHLAGLLGSQQVKAEEQRFLISFGSCAQQKKSQPIWNVMAQHNPDLFIFLGDNVYADTFDMEEMKRSYQTLARKSEFQYFSKQTPILATWDDHDYGQNDAGSEYAKKQEAQEIFLDFWDIPKNPHQEGVYQAKIINFGSLKIQVILLDTRYHRSELKKGVRGYVPNSDPQATILGHQQWAWLEEELEKPADLRIIGSSIQFLSSQHRFEKWANFPKERERLLNLLADQKINGVIFISGDRHHGELSVLEHPGISYPIYDLTSSGLTNSMMSSHRQEENAYRDQESKIYTERNFGQIEIRKSQIGPLVTLRILNGIGVRLLEKTHHLKDLQNF